MKPLPVFTALLVGCGAWAAPARAHDTLADGEPVPAWVKSQCCGVSDAHHLTAQQVHATTGGYRLDGYSQVIADKQKLPSPDGTWWVFYRDYPDGSQSSVYCFFGPDEGS
jgi:hypothetical protein